MSYSNAIGKRVNEIVDIPQISFNNGFMEDIVHQFFSQFLRCGEYSNFFHLAAACKSHMKSIVTLNLKMCCPPKLRIIDAQMLAKIGIQVKNEPPINNLALLKRFKTLSLYTQNKAGITYLTVGESLTLRQLITVAAQGDEHEQMKIVSSPDNILKENGDNTVSETYRTMITEGFIMGTQGEDRFTQKSMVSHFGCEMPTALEQTLLCVSTWKIFKECLFGENPRMEGRTSTTFKGIYYGEGDYPVAVGNCTRSYQNFFDNNKWVPASLSIMNAYVNRQQCGVGGTNRI